MPLGLELSRRHHHLLATPAPKPLINEIYYMLILFFAKYLSALVLKSIMVIYIISSNANVQHSAPPLLIVLGLFFCVISYCCNCILYSTTMLRQRT